METYERTSQVAASADDVFAFLSDVRNLPKYLPPIHEAHPQAEERVMLHGQGPDGEGFENDGYFRVDPAARHMVWGADTERTYSGRLEVAETGASASSVTVHLEFGPHSPKDEIDAKTPDDVEPVEAALDATLESIRRQVEGDGEKLPPEALPGG